MSAAACGHEFRRRACSPGLPKGRLASDRVLLAVEPALMFSAVHGMRRRCSGFSQGPRGKVRSRGPGVTPAAIQFPACGKHLSHQQCRGDREEASPLTGGREIPFPPLRPSYPWMAVTPRSQVGPGHRSCIERRSPEAQGVDIVATVRCCSADTPSTSLSKLSRSRPTTGRYACFVTAWPMLLLRKRPPAVGPGAVPDPPPRAWGPRRFRRKHPVPC